MSTGDLRFDLQVRLDPRWVELPVGDDGDLDNWAASTVHDALVLRGRTETPAVRTLLVQAWAALVEQLRARPEAGLPVPSGAYALLSDEDLLPLTVAELTGHPLATGSFDAFVDALVVARSERFAEPELTEVTTGLGTAVRLQQLRVIEGMADEDATVETSVVYAWPGPGQTCAFTLSAWFGSPVDAEVCRPVLDQLAASVRRVQG